METDEHEEDPDFLKLPSHVLFFVFCFSFLLFSFLGVSDLYLLIPKALRVCFDSSN